MEGGFGRSTDPSHALTQVPRLLVAHEHIRLVSSGREWYPLPLRPLSPILQLPVPKNILCVLRLKFQMHAMCIHFLQLGHLIIFLCMLWLHNHVANGEPQLLMENT